MNGDPDEVAKFKAILMKTPLDRIQRGLDKDIITRGWKRDLAEDEPARRMREAGKGLKAVASKRRGQSWRLWRVLIAMIVLGVLLVVMTVLDIWHL